MTDKAAANQQKRLRGSPGESDNTDMSVSELAQLLQTQLADNQRIASENLDRMRETLTQSLTKRIDTLETDIKADINKLREDNNKTFGEIRESIDKTVTDTNAALDRASRTNDLIVSGVSYVHGENLANYFMSWCHALDYAPTSIPLVDMRRLVKGSASDGTVYIILIQFAITLQRNEFYGRYMKSRSLSLSHIGFTSNKRIYINENIGPAVRSLRAKALVLKKIGKLCGVFTKDGVVYVRNKPNDRDVAVMSEDELNQIADRK